MARLGYVRVSTIEQNEARQLEALEKHDIEKWFIEKVSGKDFEMFAAEFEQFVVERAFRFRQRERFFLRLFRKIVPAVFDGYLFSVRQVFK